METHEMPTTEGNEDGNASNAVGEASNAAVIVEASPKEMAPVPAPDTEAAVNTGGDRGSPELGESGRQLLGMAESFEDDPKGKEHGLYDIDTMDENTEERPKWEHTTIKSTPINKPTTDLDWRASNTVSTAYLRNPTRWKGLVIAPKEEALARMRAECSGDPALMDEVVEHMKLYYANQATSKASSFSNNHYVRKLRTKVTENLRAFIANTELPHEFSRAEFLAQRYTHPAGEVDTALSSALAQMGMAHYFSAKDPETTIVTKTVVKEAPAKKNSLGREGLKGVKERLRPSAAQFDGFEEQMQGTVDEDDLKNAMKQVKTLVKNECAAIKKTLSAVITAREQDAASAHERAVNEAVETATAQLLPRLASLGSELEKVKAANAAREAPTPAGTLPAATTPGSSRRRPREHQPAEEKTEGEPSAKRTASAQHSAVKLGRQP